MHTHSPVISYNWTVHLPISYTPCTVPHWEFTLHYKVSNHGQLQIAQIGFSGFCKGCTFQQLYVHMAIQALQALLDICLHTVKFLFQLCHGIPNDNYVPQSPMVNKNLLPWSCSHAYLYSNCKIKKVVHATLVTPIHLSSNWTRIVPPYTLSHVHQCIN